MTLKGGQCEGKKNSEMKQGRAGRKTRKNCAKKDAGLNKQPDGEQIQQNKQSVCHACYFFAVQLEVKLYKNLMICS